MVSGLPTFWRGSARAEIGPAAKIGPRTHGPVLDDIPQERTLYTTRWAEMVRELHHRQLRKMIDLEVIVDWSVEPEAAKMGKMQVRKDIFLVFVEGKSGREADYAAWFCGSHREDMKNLSEVSSAHMFRMEALDGFPEPAELCAIYETDDGAALLDAIGKAKGNGRLPESDLQGPMSWRLFSCITGSGKSIPGDVPLLLMLFADDAPETVANASSSIAAAPLAGVSYWAMARLSPVQSRKGREYGHALFVALDPSADAHSVADALRVGLRVSGTTTILLAPLSG